MKVAIDISPLKSAHRFRGIGFYTRNLVASLQSLKEPDLKIQLIKEGQIPKNSDLIHYPYFDLFQLTLPWRQLKKVIVTVHDIIPLVFPKQFPPGLKGSLKFYRQRFFLKKVQRLITDSQSSKKDIIKYLKIPSQKIQVVYLAPGKEYRELKPGPWQARLKKKYHLPEKFVLYVGDINYHKNILGLAKACKKINIPLVIVGKQAKEKEFDKKHIENQSLVQLIKKYGRDSQILRLGFVPDEDLVSLYNLALVYCQPSFYEGFGLPVLQAMACGTPVVAARVASLPEICDQAALMVDPYQTEKMAWAIKKVFSQTKLRDKLKRAGFRQVKKFSWQTTAKETLAVYRQVYESFK